jgi:hypothetical protein
MSVFRQFIIEQGMRSKSYSKNGAEGLCLQTIASEDRGTD